MAGIALIQRDLADTRARLEVWFSHRFGGEAAVSELKAANRAAGWSSESLVFAADVANPKTQVSATTATGSTVLHARDIGGEMVLTDAKGRTLYSFAPDSPSKSACYGSCAAYWPPVTGTPSAGPGVTGKLGTIKRTDGTTQVTYDGHPLYTYIADNAPGQDNGNNINLNGGLWRVVPVSAG